MSRVYPGRTVGGVVCIDGPHSTTELLQPIRASGSPPKQCKAVDTRVPSASGRLAGWDKSALFVKFRHSCDVFFNCCCCW